MPQLSTTTLYVNTQQHEAISGFGTNNSNFALTKYQGLGNVADQAYGIIVFHTAGQSFVRYTGTDNKKVRISKLFLEHTENATSKIQLQWYRGSLGWKDESPLIYPGSSIGINYNSALQQSTGSHILRFPITDAIRNEILNCINKSLYLRANFEAGPTSDETTWGYTVTDDMKDNIQIYPISTIDLSIRTFTPIITSTTTSYPVEIEAGTSPRSFKVSWNWPTPTENNDMFLNKIYILLRNRATGNRAHYQADNSSIPIRTYWYSEHPSDEELYTGVGGTDCNEDTEFDAAIQFYYQLKDCNYEYVYPSSNTRYYTSNNTSGTNRTAKIYTNSYLSNVTATATDGYLTTSGLVHSSLSIDWTNNPGWNNPIQNYKIYLSTDNNTYTLKSTTGQKPATITDLPADTYYCKVAAVSTYSESAKAGPAITTIHAAYTPCGPAQNFTATRRCGQITLSWTAGADGGNNEISEYQITRTCSNANGTGTGNNPISIYRTNENTTYICTDTPDANNREDRNYTYTIKSIHDTNIHDDYNEQTYATALAQLDYPPAGSTDSPPSCTISMPPQPSVTKGVSFIRRQDMLALAEWTNNNATIPTSNERIDDYDGSTYFNNAAYGNLITAQWYNNNDRKPIINRPQGMAEAVDNNTDNGSGSGGGNEDPANPEETVDP